ncbi:hypothetical protein RFI_28003, partial [Reticulomyxa filosa]
FLCDMLSANILFQLFTRKMIEKAAALMYCINIGKGKPLTRQGKINKAFFVVEKGLLVEQLEVDDNIENEPVSPRSVKDEYYHRGSAIGGKVLLYGSDASSTVQVVHACQVWALDVDTYFQIKKPQTKKLRMLQSIKPLS